ncbi:MAG: glycosyltransferase [Parcubacteria group bacterium]
MNMPDPKKLHPPDWIVSQGAALYHEDQSDIGAETLWHQLRKNIYDVNWTTNQYEARLVKLRDPKVLLRKGLKKILRKVHESAKRVCAKLFGLPITVPFFSDISFERPKHPSVSIVIPVFNLLPITLGCLRSLQKVKEAVSFEVIVVDDASTEPLVELVLKRIPGITYLRQTNNAGFVTSCNVGAARARGSIIYFLNNDTEVRDHWLTPLIALLKDQTVGAVGSKLLHPTGLLAEAGGVIFKSAEGWNFGKTDRAHKPEYNYVRDVDYCSGAALAIRRELFEKIGGFNRKLVPGYYEDVELCFAMRALGYRVLYQPRSVVMHYEGASSASNVIAGKKPMKTYQEVNFHKFKRLRAKELGQQWTKDLRLLPLIARRKRGLRIWVFDWFVPMPDRDYGSARMLQILSALAKDHTVSFVPRDLKQQPIYCQTLQDMGIEVYERSLGSNFTIKARLEGRFIDLVIFSRPEVMHYFYHLIAKHAPQAKTIFDTVDVHHLRIARELALTTNPTKRALLAEQEQYFKTLEFEYGKRADRIWAITPADQENFARLLPGKPIDVVAAAHEVANTVPGFSEREGLVYIGSFYHPPNIASIEYYIKNINPCLQKLIPGVTLTVMGAAVPEQLKRACPATVRFVGPVSEAERVKQYNRARVFVSPLTFGSGLKGKVVMALASGLPVVGTSVAAEGIPAINGVHLDIADQPADFAQKVAILYRDAAVWQARSKAGRELVGQTYGPERLREQINQSLSALS